MPSAGVQSKRKSDQYEPGQSPSSQQPKVSKVRFEIQNLCQCFRYVYNKIMLSQVEAEVDMSAEKDGVDSDEPQDVDVSDASNNESEDDDASSDESGEDDSGSEGDEVPIPEHVPSSASVLHAKPTIKMAKVTRYFSAGVVFLHYVCL